MTTEGETMAKNWSTARRLPAAELKELWKRWGAGQNLSQIGRALGVQHCSVRYYLGESGGISKPERVRSERVLSLDEREEISRGLARRESLRSIALRLGRSPSTISREVNRNSNCRGYLFLGPEGYRAATADTKAWERARRPKPCKLARLSRLRRVVALKLSKNWSPEQIQGWLPLRFPDDDRMRISHESIYRTLFVQARGVLRKELANHLRTGRTLRQAGSTGRRTDRKRHGIVDAVSIRERPAEVEDRAVPGHWEGDLLSGSAHSAIVTLVERSSRYTLLAKVDGRDTSTVVTAIKRQITKLPAELKKSLTWDRGMELSSHKQLSIATDIEVYFCDPQSPWQRGTNENTNGLLRQYFPDRTNLTVHSQAELNKIARQLNERPRKTLGFRTPAEIFSRAVALTV
jgi:IS30 family transposase